MLQSIARYPQGTKLHKQVCLDPKDLGIAPLRARTHVAVPGNAGLLQKDGERGLPHMLAWTLLLRNFGCTGPQKVLLNLLRLQTCVAHSGGEGERTVLSRGLCTERRKEGTSWSILGDLYVVTWSIY